MRKRKIGFYKKVIGFATVIVVSITGIIASIINSRSDTSPSVSQNVEISITQTPPVELEKSGEPDLPKPPPPLPEEKPSGTHESVQTPLPPSFEMENIKIFAPKIWGDSSPGSAFGGNVRIDLMQINYNNQAVGKITVSGYEPREFVLDRHFPPVEIGSYRIMAVDTGNDYAEFRITRGG